MYWVVDEAGELTSHGISQLLPLMIKARQLRHLGVSVHLHAEGVLHHLHV